MPMALNEFKSSGQDKQYPRVLNQVEYDRARFILEKSQKATSVTDQCSKASVWVKKEKRNSQIPTVQLFWH